MPTNREWLFSLSLDELYAWFDAEHVDAQRDNNGTCPIGNGTASDDSKAHSTKPTLSQLFGILSDEVDSREKLEADAWAGCDHLTTTNGETLVNVPWGRLIGWLDRQAAITERECIDTRVNFAERIRLFQRGYDVGVHDLVKAADMANRLLTSIHSKDEPVLTDVRTDGGDGFTDSREELEHDIHSWLTSQVAITVYVTDIEAEARKWLDRQANMTAAVWSGYMADAAKQIDELHARLDHLPDERECKICDRATMVEEVNGLSAERDYWKGQVLEMLMCAGNYAPPVMDYPRPDGYVEPSLLVNDTLYSLRDFHADDQRLIAKRDAEIESYRKKLSHAIDNAHNTVMLMDEGVA